MIASVAIRRQGLRLAALACVIALVLSVLLPGDRYLVRIFTLVGVNLIMVTGLSLLFGYAGQISMGHAAFFGLGAYTSGVLTKGGMPWVLALGAGVAVAAVVGLLLAMPSLRLKGHYLAMATLGFGEIVLFVFGEFESVTGGSNGLRQIPAAQVGSYAFDTPVAKYLLIWSVAFLVLIMASNLVSKRPGRALRAIHGSERGAQACGIDTRRVKVQVFTLSAALAGLAGVLYAHYVGFISPSTFSVSLSLVLVTMVALGGMGSLPGAVIGTVLLTLLPYADAILPGLSRETVAFLQDWETDIHGMVLILVMLFMPHGLAGLVRSIGTRLFAKRVRPALSRAGDPR